MESFHHWLLIMIKVNVGKKFWHWKKKPKTCSKRSLNLRLFSNLQMRINLPWRKYLFFHQRLAILLKSYCVLRQFLGQFRFSPLLYVSLDECVLLRTKNKSERRFVWRSTWLNSYWLYQFTCICDTQGIKSDSSCVTQYYLSTTTDHNIWIYVHDFTGKKVRADFRCFCHISSLWTLVVVARAWICCLGTAALYWLKWALEGHYPHTRRQRPAISLFNILWKTLLTN